MTGTPDREKLIDVGAHALYDAFAADPPPLPWSPKVEGYHDWYIKRAAVVVDAVLAALSSPAAVPQTGDELERELREEARWHRAGRPASHEQVATLLDRAADALRAGRDRNKKLSAVIDAVKAIPPRYGVSDEYAGLVNEGFNTALREVRAALSSATAAAPEPETNEGDKP